MERRRSPLYIVLVAALLLWAANLWLWPGFLQSGLDRVVGRPLVWLYNKSTWLQQWVGHTRQWYTTSQRIERLEQDNLALRQRLGELEDNAEALAFLRATSGVMSRASRGAIEAATLGVSSTAVAQELVINRGSEDGVGVGLLVVSARGALVGRVVRVLPQSAVVQLITAGDFQVAAQVLGRATGGITHGRLGQGIQLDLVAHGDEISEGDTVVSSGNDQVPAGFVIGTVDHVGVNATTLFKDVRVKPAFVLDQPQRLLILK